MIRGIVVLSTILFVGAGLSAPDEADAAPRVPVADGVVVETDTMPTEVYVHADGRRLCVATGPGRTREVTIKRDGSRNFLTRKRVPARTTRCFTHWRGVPSGTWRVTVVEDLPGPFNPSGTGAFRYIA